MKTTAALESVPDGEAVMCAEEAGLTDEYRLIRPIQ